MVEVLNSRLLKVRTSVLNILGHVEINGNVYRNNRIIMNKVMLIGNVGKDPDVRYLKLIKLLPPFVLATTERGYTLQNGTQVPDHTDWHNLVFYRKLAKIVEQYVHKGDKLYVEGRIRYRSYDDQQGVRKYVTEILVENMEMLDP
jgi:single-strand DNA-binding protein